MPNDSNPQIVLLECDQYATFIKTVLYEDDNSPPVPINLTAYTARMQIRDRDGLVLITLTSSSGITLGGSAGTVVVRIEAAVTGTFPPADYHYELLVISAGGTSVALLKGTFKVYPGATTLT